MKRLITLAAAVALGACATQPVSSTSNSHGFSSWAGAWGASPTLPFAGSKAFEQQTIRQVVRVSTKGTRVRVLLSNVYGETPLDIGSASVALAGADGAPVSAYFPLTFGGLSKVSIPSNAPIYSDPIPLKVEALDKLSISLFLPTATGPCTCHFGAYATSEVSPVGDFSMRPFTPASTFANRAFVSGVEVESDAPVIVAFGDSITDGTASTPDANRRWPDVLNERLVAAGLERGVVNQAIAGNRVLAEEREIFGEAALARFDRDVLSIPNARWLVILEGINDIGMGGDKRPSAEMMIAGYRQMIARAHAHGVKVYGATLLPYQGARYADPAGEKVRQVVNNWIKTSGEYDGVIDFDAVMQDPNDPTKMKADLQSGDWLHPNDAGYKVMGEAVDLDLFR